MNKQNALKILNYWYTINFLEQESYPIEAVKKYAKYSKGSRKKEEKRKSLTIAFEKNISDLDEDYLRKTIANEKKKTNLTHVGASRFISEGFRGLCEEISVKTKTVIKTLLWSGMKNLPLLFIYSIQ